MAVILKRKFDLLVLKVSLDTSQSETMLSCEIEGKVDGELAQLDQRKFPALEMNLPDRLERRATLYQGYNFQLPDEIVSWVKNTMLQENQQQRPLWLHLVKPYGFLGMVPWERLLQPHLNLPMLRLPNFLANPPRESPSVLDVILCGSLPAAKESFMVMEHLSHITEGILNTVPRRTTIHVFVGQDHYHELKNSFQQKGLLDGSVILYDPENASSYAPLEATLQVSDRSGRIDNPWLLWIRDSLGGRSIDIAHFVCHGYLALDRGAMAFAESPTRNEDRRMARFVGAAELTAFLTQVGAWSVAFSSPENNYCEMGLRQLADTIAQLRPGPVVHHELPLDITCQAVIDIYRFLFGPPSEAPPLSPALFTYCHPLRLATLHGEVAKPCYSRRVIPEAKETVPSGVVLGSHMGTVTSDSVLGSIYDKEENVPGWIAASERFLEQQNLEIHKMKLDLSGGKSRQLVGLEDTLKQIQEIVANFADNTGFGGKL